MLDKIFNLDNPVWVFMGKVADIVMLNIFFIICCIPVFTIGAAFTSMYYVTLRMVKKEETYAVKEYFKAFKQNFKQATILWLIAIVVLAVLIGDMVLAYFYPELIPNAIKIITGIMLGLVVVILNYAFPLLARFENTNKNILKNALLLAFANAPSSIMFVIMTLSPAILLGINPGWMMYVVLFGFSLPVYINSIILRKIFAKFETPVEPPKSDPEDDDIIMHDDLIV